VLTQITLFLLKTLDIAYRFAGPFIKDWFTGYWTRTFVEYLCIRLRTDVIEGAVRMSGGIWIRFIVGIQAEMPLVGQYVASFVIVSSR